MDGDSTTRIDYVNSLPNEILEYIFDLVAEDAFALKMVCRGWYNVVTRYRNSSSITSTKNLKSIVGCFYRSQIQLRLYTKPSQTDLDVLNECRNCVWKLNLNETRVQNLESLSRLVNLRVLYLSGTRVHNIESLSGLVNLEVLHLGGTQVQNLEIKYLSGLVNLRELNLYGTQVQNLEFLRGLVNLRVLYLYGTQIENTDDILKLLPRLKIYG